MELVCIRKCQLFGEVFDVGDVVNVPDNQVEFCKCGGGPKKCQNKFCKGNGLFKTNRHFLPKDKTVLENDEEKEKKEIAELRKKLKKLGGTYHYTWGLGKLQQEIILKEKEKENGDD